MKSLPEMNSLLRDRLRGLLALLLAATAALIFSVGIANASDGTQREGAQNDPVAVSSLTAKTAHETLERITTELVTLIQATQSHEALDEDRFYQALGDLLQRYVDFKSFSRAVMGKYASGKRMASLDEAQAEKLQQQIDRFTTTFTGALINTYGKGLLVFEGERIEVVPPSADDASSRPDRARVKQLIYGDRATPYEVYYYLRQNDSGEWKIRNMKLETTNLGPIYRTQFENSYKVYEGDIDAVIDNWVSG